MEEAYDPVEYLTDVAFKALSESLPDANLAKCTLTFSRPNDIEWLMGEQADGTMEGHILNAINSAYTSRSIPFMKRATAVSHVVEAMRELRGKPLKKRKTARPRKVVGDHRAVAFEVDYAGGADAEFQSYLAKCCAAYCGSGRSYTAPYFTITQSSGFGKSRIIKELAEYTAEGNILTHDKYDFSMTILYLNAASVTKRSTRYPVPTPTLRDWFFHEDFNEASIKEKLLQAFTYAVTNSGSAGNE